MNVLSAPAPFTVTPAGTTIRAETSPSLTAADMGAQDPGAIVWDEMVAVWLVLVFTPSSLLWQALAVALFRLFDIAKPPPVRQLDRALHGGLGVMMDDIAAAGYALAVLLPLVHFWGQGG